MNRWWLTTVISSIYNALGSKGANGDDDNLLVCDAQTNSLKTSVCITLLLSFAIEIHVVDLEKQAKTYHKTRPGPYTRTLSAKIDGTKPLLLSECRF